MRSAKIIATLGPACADPRTLRALLRAGVDVARLNLSHGSRAEHARLIRLTRTLAAGLGRTVAILADLQGPKVRVGALPGGHPIRLRRGARVTLTPRAGSVPGAIPTTYRSLARDVRPGEPILLDDGRMELEVLRTRGGDVLCAVRVGGLLGEHKGMNLPRTRMRIAPLTAKDRSDLDFAIRQGVDYVALSFVRGPGDIVRVRRLIARRGGAIPIIAKLERREAVDRLDAILRAADGVMVARGDLGVEVPLERVPVLQKSILGAAHRAGVVAITATQMLESMVRETRPTRAEASDVANAVLDGTDAVMLSAETASGRHPLGAVAVMVRIVRAAEESGLMPPAGPIAAPYEARDAFAVAHAAVDAARQAAVRAIVVYSQTGATARVLSKLRPPCPIIAFGPGEAVRRRMALYRSVVPIAMRFARGTDALLRDGERAILRAGILKRGDRVVVVSGTSPRPGATNLMKLHRLGGRI